jgi:hypothetical protein
VADARGIMTSPALGTVARPPEGPTLQLAEHIAGRSRAAASWTRAALALDAAMLVAAVVATQLGARAAGVEPIPAVWLAIFPLLVLAGLYGRSMYDWHLRLSALDDVRAVLVTTALAAMAVLSLRVVLGGGAGNDLSEQTLRLWGFALFYVAAGRVAIHWSQVRSRAHGDTAKPTLIVGAGRVGRLTAKRLADHPEFGLRPVGFLDKEPLRDPARPRRELGPRAGDRRAQDRARGRHVLDRAQRRAPARDPPL